VDDSAELSTASLHYLRADVNASRDRVDVEAKRGRPRIWQPLSGGYEQHPDGRIRDRHRHLVTNAAIIATLAPDPVAVFFRLACCGCAVRSDRAGLAIGHYAACVYRTLAADEGWRVVKSARLDPDRSYARDVEVYQARVRSALSEPMVIASNGKYGVHRRNRLMPWSAAIQHLGTGVSEIRNHEVKNVV